jgi:hypothetical protein
VIDVTNQYAKDYGYKLSLDQASLILEKFATNLQWVLVTPSWEMAGSVVHSFSSVEDYVQFIKDVEKQEKVQGLMLLPL